MKLLLKSESNAGRSRVAGACPRGTVECRSVTCRSRRGEYHGVGTNGFGIFTGDCSEYSKAIALCMLCAEQHKLLAVHSRNVAMAKAVVSPFV